MGTNSLTVPWTRSPKTEIEIVQAIRSSPYSVRIRAARSGTVPECLKRVPRASVVSLSDFATAAAAAAGPTGTGFHPHPTKRHLAWSLIDEGIVIITTTSRTSLDLTWKSSDRGSRAREGDPPSMVIRVQGSLCAAAHLNSRPLQPTTHNPPPSQPVRRRNGDFVEPRASL